MNNKIYVIYNSPPPLVSLKHIRINKNYNEKMQVKQPSVNDLLGKVSASSDMSVRHVRNRYLESTTVGPHAYFRMVVPRIASNALLDCRGIRMRGTLTINSTDANSCVDCNHVYPFQRVKISSGTTVLLDIECANVLNSLLYNSTQDVSISAFEQSMIGDGSLATRQAWRAAPKEYIFPMWPDHTVLRRDGNFFLYLCCVFRRLTLCF